MTMDGGGRTPRHHRHHHSPFTDFNHWLIFSAGNNGSAKEAIHDIEPQPISDTSADLDAGSLVTEEEAALQPQVEAPESQAEAESTKTEHSSSETTSDELDDDRSVGNVESEETTVNDPEQPSTSGSDPASGQLPVIWRDFFKAFKKGPSSSSSSSSSRNNKQNIPTGFLKAFPKFTRRKSKRIRDDAVMDVPPLSSPLDADLCYLKPSWKNFTLSELLAATDNFSHENLIGEGGYAEVYRGQLCDGQFVAIKRLVRGSSPEEMTMDFLSELGIICHVDHPHIAKLIGYGVEGGMHLVLQLSINGSVSSLLYGPREKLSWEIRYKIALGTANGLLYLHQGCQRRIIHKDIKAANILLTEDFDAQISDFGLAKWLPENWTHHTVSKIEGTFGYLPPEFFMHGIVDEKTDVYAYGVLLLELITGRQAIDSSQHSLVMWAKPFLMQNKIAELVDPVLGESYDSKEMERAVFLAAMCVEQASVQRPQMKQAVEILMGDESTLEEFKTMQKSKLQRTYSEELFDADEYNSTRYLCDLNICLDDLLESDDDDDDVEVEAYRECGSNKVPVSDEVEERSNLHEDEETIEEQKPKDEGDEKE